MGREGEETSQRFPLVAALKKKTLENSSPFFLTPSDFMSFEGL